MKLVLDLNDSTTAEPAILMPTASYVDRVQGRVEALLLTGLHRFGAHGMDGTALDTIELSPDPDVQIVLDFYLALSRISNPDLSRIFRVYLLDGMMEIAAKVVPGDRVAVRAGISRDSFAEPWEGGRLVGWLEYVAIWRAVCGKVVAA